MWAILEWPIQLECAGHAPQSFNPSYAACNACKHAGGAVHCWAEPGGANSSRVSSIPHRLRVEFNIYKHTNIVLSVSTISLVRSTCVMTVLRNVTKVFIFGVVIRNDTPSQCQGYVRIEELDTGQSMWWREGGSGAQRTGSFGKPSIK